MYLRTSHKTLAALLFALMASPVGAESRADPAFFNLQANQIVGTWEASTRTGPCGGPFGMPFLAFTVFHAGGTLTETNMAPLAGVPTPFGQAIRGPAFGTWSYDRRNRTRTAQMRFNWFVNGLYHGYQQIQFDRIELDPDSSSLSGTFSATRNFIDGRPAIPNCGDVVMSRTP